MVLGIENIKLIQTVAIILIIYGVFGMIIEELIELSTDFKGGK